LHPCLYGIDMSTTREFVARGRTTAEIATELGADFVLYQTIEDMVQAVQAVGPDRQFCKACFDGNYPTGDITERMLSDIETDRLEATKS
jgi:amidophosphoribosyltransferase